MAFVYLLAPFCSSVPRSFFLQALDLHGLSKSLRLLIEARGAITVVCKRSDPLTHLTLTAARIRAASNLANFEAKNLFDGRCQPRFSRGVFHSYSVRKTRATAVLCTTRATKASRPLRMRGGKTLYPRCPRTQIIQLISDYLALREFTSDHAISRDCA